MASNHKRAGRHEPFKETARAIARRAERTFITQTEDIIIDPDGTIRFVFSDALASLFEGEVLYTTRASHVEPFGQGWIADMKPVGGPVLFDTDTDNPLGRVSFRTRQAALDAERDYIRRELGL